MRHGSDLAISVRHGFERAMVTIIDANLTTFIAGLVLFQFGSGPIRGFAVTLMIGIITSLFTAFFISRLIFHLLLERKIQSLSMASWFGRMRMNFLKFTKPAFALSAAVILGGLWVFFDTPSDIKNSLDFTGGADVRVVTAEEMTAQDLKKLLVDPSRAANAEFRKDFPDAQVNTVESTSESGKARKFSVKLKVSPELAAAIAKETEKDPLYRPPYVTKLQTALEGTLVPQAFTGARVTTEKGRRTNLAEIVVHNTEPLETSAMVAAVRKAMQNNSAEVVVTALANGKPDKALTKAKDLRVEFDVPKSVEDSKGLVSYVSSLLQPKAAHQQPDSAAKPEGPAIVLSNPIPDVAVIGGRMVGELKSAAIGAMLVALICIVLYIRLRFHQYKYGIAAVVALVHDVLVALGLVVLFNRLGLVYAELSLSMIAAFLTIIGYSINDTIVIFDRVRENLANQLKAGDTTRSFADTINLSINQTLSRTILTSGTTFFVVLALLFVNYGSGSELEGFAFAMIIGIITGTYSTIFIASPIVMWLRSRETHDAGLSEDGGLAELADQDEAVPAVAH
ncbi:MAG: protein translocase subunit SecF [Planctomycetes bacterium]|nr:protein translocase subunit SecF [Planctomycetota bacterium]